MAKANIAEKCTGGNDEIRVLVAGRGNACGHSDVSPPGVIGQFAQKPELQVMDAQPSFDGGPAAPPV